MALQRQKVSLSINDGVDTKTDDKNVLPTKFSAVVNADYTKSGSVTKRFGYDALSPDDVNGNTPSNAKAMTTLNKELVMFASNTLLSYSEAQQAWFDRGQNTLASTAYSSLYAEPYKITTSAMAVKDNFLVTAYVVQEGPLVAERVEVTISDLKTKAILHRDTFTGGEFVNVQILGAKVYVFFKFSGSYRYKIADLINFTGFPFGAGTPIDGVPANSKGLFTTILAFNRIYILNQSATGRDLVLRYIQANGIVSAPLTIFTYGESTATPDTMTDLSLATIQGQVIISTVKTGAIAYKIAFKDLNFVSPQYDITVVGDAFTRFRGVEKADGTTVFFTQATLAQNQRVLAINLDGTTTSLNNGNTTFPLYVRVHSYPIEVENKVYAIFSETNRPGQLQSLYLISQDGEVVSKLATEDTPQTSTGEAFQYYPIVKTDSVTLLSGIPKLNEAVAILPNGDIAGGAFVAHKYENQETSFSQLLNYFDATAAKSLHFSGGLIRMYDGSTMVEHGFLQDGFLTVTVNAGSTMSVALEVGKAYQYAVVYAWRDRWGNTHRSRPVFSEVITPTGTNFKTTTVTLRNLNLTQKQNVEIELYRTEGNGTTYYKISTPNTNVGFLLNNKGALDTQVTDDTPDASIISNEILYTQGGVLENDVAESCKYITTYKSRIFTLLSDGNTLQYSKLIVEGGPVEFSALFKIAVDNFGGSGTALAQMDDNLIIFKEQAIYALNGEGPNDLGEQDDFRKPQLITSDAGCVDANSVVVTPMGICFKSSKGIYILKRNFSVEYVGAPVEAYNSFVVTAATLLAETNQVRFALQDAAGTILVYDYFHNRWSWYENMTAIDSVVFNETYHYLRESALVLFETKTQWSDNGSFIPMSVETAWIQLAGIQGFQRFYKLHILGTYKSSHRLKVEFAYDFKPGFVDSVIIEAGNLLNALTWGAETTWGASQTWGENDQVYQFEVRPRIQKCQAFKIRITDVQQGNVVGESLQLSNFAAEIGIKQGNNKTSAAKTSGAS